MTDVFIKGKCIAYEGQGEYWVSIDNNPAELMTAENIIPCNDIRHTNPTLLEYLLDRKHQLENDIKQAGDDKDMARCLKIRWNEICRVLEASGYQEDDNKSLEDLIAELPED